MNGSVAMKLEAARVQLDELGRKTTELEAAYPDVFEDPDLRVCICAFQQSYTEARNRLKTPSLSIAMIGTTSSGKSTIVNALVGRRIAPIDEGEMSGGVLTLRHAPSRRLVVTEVEDAAWECGTWEQLSDEDSYSRVRDGVMRRYQDTRKKQTCLAPQVLLEGPLLPSVDASLLGLPHDIGMEFIDLPGLKSVNDRANLSVIQTRVHKAFSLVALDYLQADEEHRKKLLEELTHVVKYLHGRTDSMIFVLNRIDQKGTDDEPVSKRINALRQEIKEVLALTSEPEILPFESRLLYRAQCAWGAAGDEDRPTATRQQQQQHLSALFVDCASSIKRLGREKPELRPWLRQIEDIVEDGGVPNESDLRSLLVHAREWSGGRELWLRLRTRIEESFSELVILPALIDVFDAHRNLTDKLRSISRIRQIDCREQLDQERERLETVQMRLQIEVNTTHQRFRDRLNSAADGLKTGDQATRHRLTKELGAGFEGLLGAVNEVSGDLTKSLIVPMRGALKGSRGVYDFEEEMSRVLEPAPAKELARAYDLFSRRLPGLSRNAGAFIVRVRENDAAGVSQLQEIERDARRLYQNMRECLAQRAEYTLQGQVEFIRQALTGLLDQQADAITHACLSDLPDLSINQAIESARRVKSRTIRFNDPPKFFTLPSVVNLGRHEQLEVVGKRHDIEHYTTGTCFKDTKTRTVSRDVTGSVAYLDLELPDEDGMARQWASGVKGGEDSLWEILRDWMVGALQESSVSFSSAIESVLRLADRVLVEQRQFAANEYDATVERWKRIDLELDWLDKSHNRLLRTALSKSE